MNKLFLRIMPPLLVAILITIWFSLIVPYNMDEFIHYHPIICHHYQYNSLNTFRESCGGYDLNLINLGIILPLRAYPYIGSILSVIYYPLFLISPSPISARLLGMIFLIIQSLILGKIFKIRFEYIFWAMILFFPYAFQQLVDTGPVGLQLTLLIACYYLFSQWVSKLKLIYPVIIAILIFLGFWNKLSFVWYLPGLLLILFYFFWENRRNLLLKDNFRKLKVQSVVALVVLFFLLSILFLSTDPNSFSNETYFAEVLALDISKMRQPSSLFNMETIKNSGAFISLLNPLEATQRIYYVYSAHSGQYKYLVYLNNALVFIIFPSLIIWLLFRYKKKALKPALLYLIFIITCLFIISTKQARFTHHIILAFPFLILSFLELLKLEVLGKLKLRYLVFSAYLLFALTNASFWLIFPTQKIKEPEDASKIKINRILSDEYLASNYFYVIIDWGMYYYQGLYGNKNQSVIYIEPLDEKGEIEKLRELSQNYNRKLLFVYNQQLMASDYILINNSFKLKDCQMVKPDSSWQILLEEDENASNVCF